MKLTFSVGLGIVLLTGQVIGETRDQKKATLDYLRKLQAKDGGFIASASDKQPTLRATSSGLRALKYFGRKAGPREKAEAADFVKTCWDKESGGFADRPGGKPEVFTTAVGFMAVAELGMPREPYEPGVIAFLGEKAKNFEEIRIAAAGLEAVGKLPPQAEVWLKEIAKMRHEDGTSGAGDGKARETSRVTVTTLRLGGKAGETQAILKALNDGQRADGGFGRAGMKGSDLESSYQVMRAYHMLKSKPDAAKMRAFIASCRNEDGGYGVAPGKPSNVAGTYFASIILHWLGEK